MNKTELVKSVAAQAGLSDHKAHRKRKKQKG